MQGCSSIGRAPVSKTGGCEFDSRRPCHDFCIGGDAHHVSAAGAGISVGAGMQDSMSREKVASAVMWFGELFQVGVYKRSQGRIARQVTFTALVIVFAVAAWRLAYHRMWLPGNVALALAGFLLVGGMWLGFRVVNVPRFADFLIAVEAEMNKVSWPSKAELIRSAVVVIFVLFFLTVVLFGFDLVWGFVFEQIGILKKSS